MVREADNNLLARFEEYLVRLGLSPATVVNYLADMRGVARWCVESGQGCSLLNLTTDDVRAYCQYLRAGRGLSPATVNRHLQAIRKFCDFAQQANLMESNPAADVRPIQAPPTSRRALDADEIARLLEAVQAGRPSLVKRDYAIIQLLLQTGIKVGELTELQLADIELTDSRGTLTVTGNRGNGHRRIPLNALACQALQEYLRVRPPSPGVKHLFLSQEGNSISARTVQRLVNVYTRAADLTGVSAHTLRYTFATSMLEETGDVATVANLLGHRSVETTLRYISNHRQHKLIRR
ncbi:MAG: tyrosine-type recombinase/integrase [Anaerolineae bacterium]|nr:tyrosine-type recombinase/integrase [Anaerolineae bacterium]